MKKNFGLIFSIFALLLQASISSAAQMPREGYIHTADGIRLFYKIVGSGTQTLISVHGGPGGTMDSMLPDLEPLVKDRRVIYYDQRGSGRSDVIKERDKLVISKHIEDLETLRQHFKLDKMTLLGSSWGGMLISFYAAAYPDKIERMILNNSGEPTSALAAKTIEETLSRLDRRYNAEQKSRLIFLSNPENWVEASDPRAICREYYQMIFPTFVANPKNLSKLKGDLCTGSEESIRYHRFTNMHIWNSLGDFNLLPSLKVVKAPVLVIHGVADPIPVESSEAWAQGYPNARLLLIKDAGHIPHVEQSEIFFKAVEIFLKGDFPAEAKKSRLK